MKLTSLKLLCFAFGAALGCLAMPGSAAINEEAEAEINEIVDDCTSRSGLAERLLNAPFQLLTFGIVDVEIGVGKCVDRTVRERAIEAEREQERARGLLMQNCAIKAFRCGSDENQRSCESLWGLTGDSCYPKS